MSFVPPTTKLHGLSVERATLMGMPHVGCNGARIIKGAKCPICGKLAANAHHAVPKGMARANLLLPFQGKLGYVMLTSPLIAVCGWGTCGCHGHFHDGKYRIKWIWHEDYAELWWSGDLLNLDTPMGRLAPNSQALFQLGHYEITENDTGKLVTEIYGSDEDGD